MDDILEKQLDSIVAVDFFTVPPVTFRALYVFVLISMSITGSGRTGPWRMIRPKVQRIKRIGNRRLSPSPSSAVSITIMPAAPHRIHLNETPTGVDLKMPCKVCARSMLASDDHVKVFYEACSMLNVAPGVRRESQRCPNAIWPPNPLGPLSLSADTPAGTYWLCWHS